LERKLLVELSATIIHPTMEWKYRKRLLHIHSYDYWTAFKDLYSLFIYNHLFRL